MTYRRKKTYPRRRALAAAALLLGGAELLMLGGSARCPTPRTTAAVLGPGPVVVGRTVPTVVPPPALEEEAESWDEATRTGPGVPRGRSHIGVAVADVPAAQSPELGIAAGTGAVILEVDAFGPGSRSHLLPGDVILSVDRLPVRGGRDVSRIVEFEPAGEGIAVDILRAGARYTAQVVPLAAL